MRRQLGPACAVVTAARPEGVFAGPLQHRLAVLHDRPTFKGGKGHLQADDSPALSKCCALLEPQHEHRRQPALCIFTSQESLQLQHSGR